MNKYKIKFGTLALRLNKLLRYLTFDVHITSLFEEDGKYFKF